MSRAVSLVFFVSGAAGLIFEVVWFNRSGLVFGNSVWAASLVLSSFMAGLAGGNALVACFAHRIRRHLFVYAALEAVVAGSGIAVTYGLIQLTAAVAAITPLLFDAPRLMILLRLVISFGVLVVPTTAMGATLPVLVAAVCRGRSGFGRALGRLYGWDTLGAVAE